MMTLLALMIALPLTAGFVLALTPRNRLNTCRAIATCTCSAMLLITILLFGRVGKYDLGGWFTPVGINLSLDGLSWLMLFSISLVTLTVIIFSFQYMNAYTSAHRYYALFMLMAAGMNGTAISGDIFNRFVYVEVALIGSYILVGFGCEARELVAALRYAVLGAVASAFTLLGVAVIYSLYGSLNIAHLGQSITAGQVSASLSPMFFAAVVMILGFAYKAAAVPVHIWQPEAMAEAPATVSAVTSAALVQIVGIYAMARTMFIVFGVTEAVGWMILSLGLMSLVFGAAVASKQSGLRKMLAYQSISQIGYILAGLGMGGILIAGQRSLPAAAMVIAGSVFHMLNHAVFMSLLFLTAGAFERAGQITGLAQLGAVAKKMPVTSAAATAGWASMAAVPPFAGFFSKAMIIIGAFQGGFYFIGLLAAGTAIFTMYEVFKLHKQMYAATGEHDVKAQKLPFSMKAAMIVPAALCVVLSVLAFGPMRKQILTPAQQSISQRQDYINIMFEQHPELQTREPMQ